MLAIILCIHLICNFSIPSIPLHHQPGRTEGSSCFFSIFIFFDNIICIKEEKSEEIRLYAGLSSQFKFNAYSKDHLVYLQGPKVDALAAT